MSVKGVPLVRGGFWTFRLLRRDTYRRVHQEV